MIVELTQEQKVTQILSSNEILKYKNDFFYNSNGITLGEYLRSLPDDEIVEEAPVNQNTKYTFIKTNK